MNLCVQGSNHAEKKPGPGGGLGTGARIEKRREDSEAVTECHPGSEGGKGGVYAVSPASALLGLLMCRWSYTILAKLAPAAGELFRMRHN